MSSKATGAITEIVIALFLAALSAALVAMQDVTVPDQLQSIEGTVISRTPIHGKGKKLTGFRFCIDQPRMTFTYSDSAPRLEEAWTAINANDNVRVQYEPHDRSNPTLWGLEINGQEVANSLEIRNGRIDQMLIWLGVCIASLAYALWKWRSHKKAAAA